MRMVEQVYEEVEVVPKVVGEIEISGEVMMQKLEVGFGGDNNNISSSSRLEVEQQVNITITST